MAHNGFKFELMRLACWRPGTAELQQQAERRELGDDLRACCARQCAENGRKSDARHNAQDEEGLSH